MSCLVRSLLALLTAAEPLPRGDHTRTVRVGEVERSYRVHVPARLDRSKPAPVVLAFHGAGMNGRGMALLSGLSRTADRAGFIVAYPNGTGLAGLLLTWNAGGFGRAGRGKRPDDVAFVRALLDDLAAVAPVDARRVYAAGMSNGAMMCYRLAAELSDRIAAVACVAGTMAIDNPKPSRPVPVLHMHGTADRIVPFGGSGARGGRFMRFKSVRETVQLWAKLNECKAEPTTERLGDKDGDGRGVRRIVYGPGKAGAEVVLYEIDGGGHTWPGRPGGGLLGKSTKDIVANDVIWEFFRTHPMPPPAAAPKPARRRL